MLKELIIMIIIISKQKVLKIIIIIIIKFNNNQIIVLKVKFIPILIFNMWKMFKIHGKIYKLIKNLVIKIIQRNFDISECL